MAEFSQGFLGVLPVRDDPGPGVEVRDVYPNSPADKAGVKAGDRIMRIDCPPLPGQPPGKQPIIDRDRFLDLMARQQPGADVKLDVVRKGRQQDGDAVGQTRRAARRRAGRADRRGVGQAGAEEGRQARRSASSRSASADNTHAYYVYVPEKYDPTIDLRPGGVAAPAGKAGKVREDDIKKFEGAWEDSCAANHLILVMPLAENEDGWKRDEAGFVQEAVKAVKGPTPSTSGAWCCTAWASAARWRFTSPSTTATCTGPWP